VIHLQKTSKPMLEVGPGMGRSLIAKFGPNFHQTSAISVLLKRPPKLDMRKLSLVRIVLYEYFWANISV